MAKPDAAGAALEAATDWRDERDAELEQIVDAAVALESRLLAERDAEIKRLREQVEVADDAAAKAQKYMHAINVAAEADSARFAEEAARLRSEISRQAAELRAVRRGSRLPVAIAALGGLLIGMIGGAVGALLGLPPQ